MFICLLVGGLRPPGRGPSTSPSPKKKFKKNMFWKKISMYGVFYMSSISAMGPQIFHWKNKLWVRGGRSRLALSENIDFVFFSAVFDRFMPSKPANLRVPYKIRFSIFFEKSKNGVNPMVWRCREFFFSNIFGFYKFCSTRFFPNLIFWVIFDFKA